MQQPKANRPVSREGLQAARPVWHNQSAMWTSCVLKHVCMLDQQPEGWQ